MSLRLLLGSLILRLYPERVIDGIRVRFSDVSADNDEDIARLRAALQMLRAAEAPYRRLAERIRQLVVWPGNYSFAARNGDVYVASSDVRGLSTEVLSSVLVHEATHLRLFARGIKDSSECEARVEAICVRRQLAFLRQLGARGAELATDVETVLSVPWWTEDVQSANVERLFENHRLPRWLLPFVRRRRS